MNEKKYEEMLTEIANLATTAREAARAVSLLAEEIEAMKKREQQP